MMGSLFFFIKSLIFTFVVILLLQVRIGQHTVEDYTMNFVTNSALIEPIDRTANAVVVFIRNSWNQVTKGINTNFSRAIQGENRPGEREQTFSLKRSQEYIQEQSARARSQAEELESSETYQNAKNTSVQYLSDLKTKAREVSRRVQSRFVDETKVPGDSSRASHTDDDGTIDGSNDGEEL